jgi:hypothetical protein
MNILEKIDNYLNEDPISDMLKDFESAKFKKIVNSLPSKDKKNMQKYVKDAIRMATSKDDKSLEFMKLVPKIMDIFDRNNIDIFNESIDSFLRVNLHLNEKVRNFKTVKDIADFIMKMEDTVKDKDKKKFDAQLSRRLDKIDPDGKMASYDAILKMKFKDAKSLYAVLTGFTYVGLDD